MFIDKICTVVEKVLKTLVLLSCLGVVLWQLWQCFTKFLSAPQSTHMSMTKAAGNDMFPSIIICPYPHTNTTLNSTILSECGINWKEYLKEAKWSNKEIEKCQNPNYPKSSVTDV